MLSNARKNILSRLKAVSSSAQPVTLPEANFELIFSDRPTDGVQALDQFVGRLQALKGEVFVCTEMNQAASALKKLLNSEVPERVIFQDHELLGPILKSDPDLAKYKERARFEPLLDARQLSQFKIGVTAADVMIARTGSICLNARSAQGRRMSVLPEFHIVIASRDQLQNDFSCWLQNLKQSESTSYATIITGPSRTADIEKILVLGAHGPKRLAVIILP